MNKSHTHSFHIPVMGLGFTIDTPIKVAKYGISSVVSIMDDQLIEQMRECICNRENFKYTMITVEEHDYRAKRITAYLNLLNLVVKTQVDKIRNEDFEVGKDIHKYFQFLPDNSELKKSYIALKRPECSNKKDIIITLRESIRPGSIDVNIMTKVDKVNYSKSGKELESEYSDALSALRGYAKSEFESSIVFSAGLNPRLYSYCENFDDFFPGEDGQIRKKITLKVSDYRSALIQGKFLAKKGLWVSEFRIESGINCGGHAFVSSGALMGPILDEFKVKRNALMEELYTDCVKGLKQKDRLLFKYKPSMRITAQGGIGTSEEHNFIRDYYDLDSVGWGSPFLLVPEATNVDEQTLKNLATAKQDDYYLSHASPLGVPFHNFRLSSSEVQRKNRILKNKPGSPCYKKFLSTNKEYTELPICTSSRQYQILKIEELKHRIVDKYLLQKEIDLLLEKDCLCEGLGASALLVSKAKLSHKLSAVTICPGPNLAYFSGIFSLKDMIDHIYGRVELLNNLERPNCFINELQLYFNYLKKDVENSYNEINPKKAKYFESFIINLLEGIDYYESLIKSNQTADLIFHNNNQKFLKDIRDSLIILGNDLTNVQNVCYTSLIKD